MCADAQVCCRSRLNKPAVYSAEALAALDAVRDALAAPGVHFGRHPGAKLGVPAEAPDLADGGRCALPPPPSSVASCNISTQCITACFLKRHSLEHPPIASAVCTYCTLCRCSPCAWKGLHPVNGNEQQALSFGIQVCGVCGAVASRQGGLQRGARGLLCRA